jgi:ppGpp synthetase/RelA/SpoT-type nucleotidyltranferase
MSSKEITSEKTCIPVDRITFNIVEKSREYFHSQYKKVEWNFKEICKVCVEKLEKSLKCNNIDYFIIECRVKEFDSLFDKIYHPDNLHKKYYEDPFLKVPDIGGLRLVLYSEVDFQKVEEKILNKYFKISRSETDDKKEKKLSEGKFKEFAYLSRHYKGNLKEEFFPFNEYSPMGNSFSSFQHTEYLSFSEYNLEIQLRTVSMHAWASIAHGTVYKPPLSQANISDKGINNGFLTPENKRSIYQISALFEIIDEKINNIMNNKRKRYEEILNHYQKTKKFKRLETVDLESFKAFLDSYFEKADRNSQYFKIVLKEVNNSNLVTFEKFIDTIKSKKNFFSELYNENPHFAQIDLFLILFALTSDDFLERDLVYINGYSSFSLFARTNSWEKALSFLKKIGRLTQGSDKKISSQKI